MDTIFSLSTSFGKSGVAVIRVSGPTAVATLGMMTSCIPEPHKASLRRLYAKDGTLLDEALVLVFPKGKSFTGEAVVEIQCHGSPAIIEAILDELSKAHGLRPAEAGEFTRRALENGCLDLAQVEGLADLIEAETEFQRRQALRIFSGDLGRQAEIWRMDLIRAAALIEATIDFADEDVPVDVSPEVGALLQTTRSSLRKEIAGAQVAERIRSGFEVAIVGAPNVGKSTLLNALAGREAAITSEYAGTTRDVIEVRMDLSGLPVTLLDTAGIRMTDDVVENIGIDRAKSRAAAADLRVFLVEAGKNPELTPEGGDVVVTAKVDLETTQDGGISGLTGYGIERLIESITETLKSKASAIGVATRIRHKVAMERAERSIESAQNLILLGETHADVAAEELRSAIRALDSLVGRIDVENILDEIFASFCLGK